MITIEQLRNTRAWAASRVGTLSGAAIIVAACDEAIAARAGEVLLYLEAHITIDPVFDEKREAVRLLAEVCGFKLAKLVMRKDVANEEEHRDDAFLTGHGKELDALQSRMVHLVQSLRAEGVHVRRYKIENTLMDSRIFDKLELL